MPVERAKPSFREHRGLHHRFNQAATKRFVGGSNIGSVVCTTLKGQCVLVARARR